MHLLLYSTILLTASAVHLPIYPRADPCGPGDESVSDDGPTGDHTAGIGAEFESPTFTFRKAGCGRQSTYNARQKVIDGHAGADWKLTADSGGSIDRVAAEYILDGTKIKVGTGDAARAGAAAANDLIQWHPWTTLPRQTVNIAESDCNPWTIDGPSHRDKAEDLVWFPQITAPMPFEALYSLMKEQWVNIQDPNSPLNVINGENYNIHGNGLIVVTQKYFQSNRNGIDQNTVSDDVLGFCSLVLSYAKLANRRYGTDQSPKLAMTFMPRTNFNRLFEEVKSKIPGDLFDLFDSLSCYKTAGIDNVIVDPAYCSGSPKRPRSKHLFETLAFTNDKKSNSVKTWIEGMRRGAPGSGPPTIDDLTDFDASVDGSIGKLGYTTEKMYNSQRSVPLFEFRDLKDTKTSDMASFMARVDQAIQDLHHTFADSPTRKRKRQLFGNCTMPAPTAQSLPMSASASTTAPPFPQNTSTSGIGSITASPSMSCVYQDATPETSEACTCVSGASTTVVKPMSLASPTIITQSCDYSTWPSSAPSVTQPSASVITDIKGCQVCTVVGPNEDNCTPLPSSLSCTTSKTSTILSADTSGVSVGTLTGTALYSKITSAIDSVCQVPPNNGKTGNFTCTETATATVASNIKYIDHTLGDNSWSDEGSLTLQVEMASYDSLLWYDTNKAILAAFASNSTQGNCKSTSAFNTNKDATGEARGGPPPAEKSTFNVCQAGSDFQLTEDDPLMNPKRELLFNLRFQTSTQDTIKCEYLMDVIDFIEIAVSAVTDTEEVLPEELAVEQKLLDACEGKKVDWG